MRRLAAAFWLISGLIVTYPLWLDLADARNPHGIARVASSSSSSSGGSSSSSSSGSSGGSSSGSSSGGSSSGGSSSSSSGGSSSGGAVLACATPGVTVGGLHIVGNATRTSGISPLGVFFDLTGSSSSNLANANATAFQDITYSVNFGDGNASGTGTWRNGSNPGNDSRNAATGAISAHPYTVADNSGDQTLNAVITATDGANVAQCKIPVTVYDPAGANGFPGSATTCAFNASQGSGCPSGAGTVTTSTLSGAITGSMSGKRVLLKCGDTFNGGVTITGQKFSVGSYGSCVGTQTGRPVIGNSSGDVFSLNGNSASVVDGRFADLDAEGTNPAANGDVFNAANGNNYPSQITIINVKSAGSVSGAGYGEFFYDYNATQIMLADNDVTGMGSIIQTYINSSENQCANGSNAYQCGQGSGAVYRNVDYTALLGNSFNGTGAAGTQDVEVVRLSACRLCVISFNTFENALNGGAPFKMHNGNPSSQATWIGQYTELSMVTDNLFTGHSGAQLCEIAPQNAVTDERLQNIVFERNLLYGVSGSSGKCIFDVQNGSVRDNVSYGVNTGGSQYAFQFFNRGYSWNYTSGAPVNNSAPQYDEAYNNTCDGAICVGFTAAGYTSSTTAAPANNGLISNNLMYSTGGGSAVTNGGTGNTISNNTATVTNNPGFVGPTTAISGFQPTANYSGALNGVPVFYDALGTPWSPTWDLGAVHP